MTSPADPLAPEAQAAIRAVLHRALRDLLVLLAVLVVLGVVVGGLVAGVAGVWGALVGAALALLFSGTTIWSMLRTVRSGLGQMSALVMGAWLVKVVVLVVVLAVLRGMDFYHPGVLVVVLTLGVVGSAFADYRAVGASRTPYVVPVTTRRDQEPGTADAGHGDGPG
ncbi:hypothetical protein [Cellulomonas phragmiteti]|uniref:ATP synthase protein I n=1 Tax=Cellulomonas phragmiteti TaxID=478780 RepID=A0ABQ4DQ72_9CELL|nr:hypothetical protein [Cellulomonas phragmiteti]GIG41488.1 hypothetical protein Cph01nite_32500 [Cellulomonas phragmiteti]